jgi:hypothetical protein
MTWCQVTTAESPIEVVLVSEILNKSSTQRNDTWADCIGAREQVETSLTGIHHGSGAARVCHCSLGSADGE